MNNYTIKMLFPTCIHEYVYDKFNTDELINFCYDQRDKNPDGQFNSNRGGWHSKFFDIDPIAEEMPRCVIPQKAITGFLDDISLNYYSFIKK